jgi:integrase
MAKLPTGLTKQGRGIKIRAQVDGKSYTETLRGNLGPRHVASAVKRREQIIAQLTLGDLGIEYRNFEDVAQDWLNTLDVKRSTSISYEGLLNKYWIDPFQKKPLASITAPDIKRVLASHSVSNKTKKNALAVLSSIMAHAEIHPNPCRQVKIRRNQKAPIERYTPSERETLLGALEGDYRVFFAVLFGCGLRTGEALALTWADYDGESLDINKQVVRRRLEKSTKTSVRRKVFVPQWTRKYINGLPSRFSGDYIFPNQFGRHHQDADNFNEAWQKAHKRCRLPYRIPYVCRHTRAAELLSAGVAPAAAAKQLGHSVEIFLRTYSEYLEEYGTDASVFDTPLSRKLPIQK